jgi:hypothetical protein
MLSTSLVILSVAKDLLSLSVNSAKDLLKRSRSFGRSAPRA